MDLSKLDGPQRIAAVGGIVLLLASFLPWYSVLGFGVSGWNAGALAIVGIVLGVAAAGLVTYAALSDADVEIGSFAAPQVGLIGGVGSVVFILLRLLTAMDFVSIGLFLGIAGAGVVTFGAYRSVVAAGLTVPFVGASSTKGDE